MPPALALIPIAISAATAGLGLANALGGSGGGSSSGPTPAQITQQAIQQETQNRKQAATEAQQLVPGLIDNTSGSLSPTAYTDLSAQFSGNANYAQDPTFQAIMKNFLGGGGTSFGGENPYGSFNNSFASPGLSAPVTAGGAP